MNVGRVPSKFAAGGGGQGGKQAGGLAHLPRVSPTARCGLRRRSPSLHLFSTGIRPPSPCLALLCQRELLGALLLGEPLGFSRARGGGPTTISAHLRNWPTLYHPKYSRPLAFYLFGIDRPRPNLIGGKRRTRSVRDVVSRRHAAPDIGRLSRSAFMERSADPSVGSAGTDCPCILPESRPNVNCIGQTVFQALVMPVRRAAASA